MGQLDHLLLRLLLLLVNMRTMSRWHSSCHRRHRLIRDHFFMLPLQRCLIRLLEVHDERLTCVSRRARAKIGGGGMRLTLPRW